LASNKDLAYWTERTRRFGARSIGYGCDDRLIHWDNVLRARAISRLVTVKPGLRVLDVGTGAGYWAIKCAKAGAIVTAVDFSEDLLRLAEVNARKAGVNVTWLCTALEQAHLPQDVFDIVLSVTCLQHITERERQMEALRRVLRALRPRGVLVLVEDTTVGDPEVSDYMTTYRQDDWIALVQSQGGQLLRFVGVSFLRFGHPRIPLHIAVAIDFMVGHLQWLKTRAAVTAFAFTKP